MQKLISIIIPCYNVETYIDRCVKSLINQTIGVENLELIFVNDASTDNTLEKLFEYEKLYENSIIVINLPENMRQGGARNVGIKYSSSEYIGFVDSDDWIEFTMYEKLYNKMIEMNCDIVACDYVRDFGDCTIELGLNGEIDKFVIIQNEEDRKRVILDSIKSGIWTKIYKKEFLSINNIYFPEYLTYEDNYFNSLCLMYVKRYYVIEEYLYHYYANPNSTILSNNSSHHYDRLIIELMIIEELKKRNFFNIYHDEIEFLFLKKFYINTLHTLILRFDVIPYDIFLYMKECVLNIFPKYKQNPYITSNLKGWIETIELDLSPSDLNELVAVYRESMN